MHSKFLRFLVGLAASIFLASIFYNALMDNEYVNFIRVPDPELGKVVAYHVKGIVVYITEAQSKFICWLRVLEFSSGGLAFSGMVIQKYFDR